MRIIPAIDILHGKCVRLTQGDFKKAKIYHQDPVEVALQFQDAGLKYLHVVDLEGARKGKVISWNTVIDLQEKTELQIDFGGGVKTAEDVERLLRMDIGQINIGSMAVKEPEKFLSWLKEYGSEHFILSADVVDENVMIHGWVDSTKINLFDLVDEYVQHGLAYLTCTDISKDGMLQGPNFELYKKLKNHFPSLNITASGGVTSLEDLRKLKSLSVDGVIVGKAIYEHEIKLRDLKSL